MNRKLNINGSLGYKANNLRENHIATTERASGVLNLNYQIIDQLGLDFLYNFETVNLYRAKRGAKELLFKTFNDLKQTKFLDSSAKKG